MPIGGLVAGIIGGVGSALGKTKQATGMNIFQRIKANREAKKAGQAKPFGFMGTTVKDPQNGSQQGLLSAVAGNLRFGADKATGFIPIIIAAAVALAIAIGGGLFRVGRKRRRR